jgi:hypothetical protein
MALISSDTRFIGISTSVNLTERKSALINDQTEPYTMQDFIDTIGSQGLSGLYAQTALGTLITNTTVESSLIGTGVGTLSVPPNTFQVGDSYTAKICGYLSCANNATIHFRVKSDGTIIADAGVFQMKITTNKFFELAIDFTVTKIGVAGVAELFTNGQYSYNHNSQGELSGNNFASVTTTIFDTTVLNALSITAEWGAASASNKIQSQNFVLTKVY